MIQDEGKPMMLALRLKVENGRITEAEHLLSAPGAGPAAANVVTPRPGLLREIPPGERLPHGRLMAIGATYYDALDDNDGSAAPFAADCQRRENGMTTAGEGARRAADQGRRPLADRPRLQGPDGLRLVHLHRPHREPADDRRRPGDGPGHGRLPLPPPLHQPALPGEARGRLDLGAQTPRTCPTSRSTCPPPTSSRSGRRDRSTRSRRFGVHGALQVAERLGGGRPTRPRGVQPK
ncbi:MAG: hypothetical protein WDM92_12780 [Caulobacteraceae bacterium]